MPPSEVERAARRHVPGAGEVAIRPLASGVVNETFRVARDGRLYSLRMPARGAADSGPDREWECRVLDRAGAAGLAPEVVCCDPGAGILVARWVEGGPFEPQQASQTRRIEEVARLVRRVHMLPPPTPPRIMSPAGWIAHYRSALVRRGADSRQEFCAAGVDRHLAALRTFPAPPPVLCHSDLHAANLVAADRGLVLLDWEYAHVSDPFWDLAGWASNNDFDAKSARSLLASYLDRQPADEEARRLGVLQWLYDYVCVLWSDLYSRVGGAGAGIMERAGFLAARLERDSGGRAG